MTLFSKIRSLFVRRTPAHGSAPSSENSSSEIIRLPSPKRPQRVPAIVFACLLPAQLRIVLHPGEGLADGGFHRDVPIEIVPAELRMPNTPLWLTLDERMEIVSVERREE